MNAVMRGGSGKQRTALLGAAFAALVIGALGFLVIGALGFLIAQQRAALQETETLTETLAVTEQISQTPFLLPPPKATPAQRAVQTVSDPSQLFTLELLADWAITLHEGRKGIQLSRLTAQSPDFRVTLDTTAEEPFVPRRYERGAEFSAHVVRGRKEIVTEQSARTVGLLESSPVIIGGVSGVLRSGAGISTMQGRNLDAIIHTDGLNYIFTFGYNPDTYPRGEHVFREILSSFQFTTSTTPPPTPTPTPSPYLYQRPNIWE